MADDRCTSHQPCQGSNLGDVAGLRAFGAVDNLELHRLTLLERAEPIALDGRVMDEDIAASITLDEAIPLCVVEPLDLACDAQHREGPVVQQRKGVWLHRA